MSLGGLVLPSASWEDAVFYPLNDGGYAMKDV
jgi:hypothetical protein